MHAQRAEPRTDARARIETAGLRYCANGGTDQGQVWTGALRDWREGGKGRGNTDGRAVQRASGMLPQVTPHAVFRGLTRVSVHLDQARSTRGDRERSPRRRRSCRKAHGWQLPTIHLMSLNPQMTRRLEIALRAPADAGLPGDSRRWTGLPKGGDAVFSAGTGDADAIATSVTDLIDT